MVYLVRPGEEPTEAELLALEQFRRSLETRFAILTGGRGALETYLSPPGGDPGEPPPVDPGDVRPDPASLADALRWLRTRQEADGSWRDKPETEVRDSAVVAEALASLDALFTGQDAAKSWLESRVTASSDYSSRALAAIRALPGGSYSALVTQIASRQNPDGGWGAGRGFSSDPLDTALALLALRAAGGGTAALQLGGDYLLTAQNLDGGWGMVRGGASRIASTATVLEALASLARAEGVAANALSWLATKQNADGGFGDSPSTVHDSALALAAAIENRATDAIDAPAALAYLRERQTIEGSWEGSVYSTALVSTALARADFPDLAVAGPVAIDPEMAVQGEPISISFRVRNVGSLPAAPTVAKIFDGEAGSELL
ncbi:MAG: prenyltransferase/squalene oxidase repeat-containing protein, partial [Myxococcota bacterium]